MTDGPQAGLAALDNLRSEPKLSGYHLLSAAAPTYWPAPASQEKRCSRSTRPSPWPPPTPNAASSPDAKPNSTPTTTQKIHTVIETDLRATRRPDLHPVGSPDPSNMNSLTIGWIGLPWSHPEKNTLVCT